ncbi:MAG: hypothetical protein WBW53_15735 [Terriglobales bacterium]
MTAERNPKVVILDLDLLHVDQENIAEYIKRISPSTLVVLTVDNPSRWHNIPPVDVKAVAERGDFDSIVSLVQHLQ